jgi:hypothetical protein
VVFLLAAALVVLHLLHCPTAELILKGYSLLARQQQLCIFQPGLCLHRLFAEIADFLEGIDEFGKACVSQRSSQHLGGIAQSVDLLVGDAVAVGIAFECECLVEPHFRLGVEQVVGLHLDLAAAVDVDCLVLEGSEGSNGRPGELVAQGVVAATGRGQSAAPAFVLEDLPFLLPDLVDDLHGGEVVDAGVEAHLVEEDESLLPRLLVELLQFLADVGGRDHVPADCQAGLGDVNVQEGRDVADHDVRSVDDRLELGAVLHVDLAVGATAQSPFLRQLLRVFEDVAGNVNAVLGGRRITFGLASR